MAESRNSANSANSATSVIAADDDQISAADHNENIAPELEIQIIIDPHLAHLVHPDLHLQHPGLLVQPPDIVLDAVVDNEEGSDNNGGIADEDSVSDSITTDKHDEHDEFPVEPPILEVVRRSQRLERLRGEFMYYKEVTRRGRTFTYPVYQPSKTRQQGFDVSVEFPECFNDSDSDYSS
jgi:hypothetical protein